MDMQVTRKVCRSIRFAIVHIGRGGVTNDYGGVAHSYT